MTQQQQLEKIEKKEEEEKQITIIVDGVPTKLESPDVDGDGITGETESLMRGQQGITSINQPTELGETLKELNKDVLETSRMTAIDLRARLHYVEIANVLALDSLVALGVCPTECLAFTRQKKRLSVSLDGKGRDDIVQIVAGKRELDAKAGGFMNGMKGMMGMQPK